MLFYSESVFINHQPIDAKYYSKLWLKNVARVKLVQRSQSGQLNLCKNFGECANLRKKKW